MVLMYRGMYFHTFFSCDNTRGLFCDILVFNFKAYLKHFKGKPIMMDILSVCFPHCFLSNLLYGIYMFISWKLVGTLPTRPFTATCFCKNLLSDLSYRIKTAKIRISICFRIELTVLAIYKNRRKYRLLYKISSTRLFDI